MLFTPNAKGEKNGQQAIERKVVSIHICPRCDEPIQAIVLSKQGMDPSLFGAGSRYECWPVGNSAGIAGVQWLAKDHLSDWCLSQAYDPHRGFNKQRSYARSCLLVAFFSPSPSEQVRKLLSAIGSLSSHYLPDKDLFSWLENEVSTLVTILDVQNQFHPMFALDLSHPSAASRLRTAVSKMLWGD